MKRILSLDWDYFIKATSTQRLMLFPDGGNENISYELQDFIWNSRYSGSPEIRSIGILKDDYETIHKMLSWFTHKYQYSEVSNTHKKMLVTVSHKWIYDFIIQRTKCKEHFEVYNVDFHHDMYNFRTHDEEVNCGNWVNCLMEKRPNMQYFWVKREDSDIRVIGGDPAPCDIKSIRDIERLEFDYVFICRSDCWSPPHLDNYFETLWVLQNQCMPVEIEDYVKKCRKVSVIPNYKELNKEAFKF